MKMNDRAENNAHNHHRRKVSGGYIYIEKTKQEKVERDIAFAFVHG